MTDSGNVKNFTYMDDCIVLPLFSVFFEVISGLLVAMLVLWIVQYINIFYTCGVGA